jgi:uncharacterized integral membrane protein
MQPKAAVLDDKDSWFDAKALGLGAILSVVLFFTIRSLVGSEFSLFYWMLSIPIIVEIILHFFVLPPLLLIAVLRKIIYSKSTSSLTESSPKEQTPSFSLFIFKSSISLKRVRHPLNMGACPK